MKNFKETPSQKSIDFITNKAETEPDFFELLVASLKQARTNAQENLNSDLFKLLVWPTDVPSYIAFLETFAKWIPQQSDHKGWKDPVSGFSQEVYDNLCHFYYLIDQPVGPNNQTLVQNIEWFSEWLIGYANVWGSFLNTPESFNEDIMNSFIDFSPYYRIEDSLINGKPNAPNGWNSFNEFFARELNPGLRPICEAENNKVITAPADCTYRMQYPIQADSSITEITIKKTHSYAKINNLLKGSQYADSFANGTFVHYFLGPYSYHRFHTPVAGLLKESYAIQGKTFLEVNLKGNQFDAPDNAPNGYQFSQARGILTIDTTNSPYGDMGIVAVIPVGMCQVSSVHMTAQPNTQVAKGDEFGYFMFGGSDIIMLFQEGKAPKLDGNSGYRYYGTNVSEDIHSPK